MVKSSAIDNNRQQPPAPVAQLDRASVFGTEGWGFESLRVYFPRQFQDRMPGLFWTGPAR